MPPLIFPVEQHVVDFGFRVEQMMKMHALLQRRKRINAFNIALVHNSLGSRID